MSRTRRLSTTVRNCTRDEGGPFEAGSQVQVSSHRKLLSSRATGGSGQSAALTAERVSASLWRISPLAVSDEVAMRAIWFVLATLLLLPPAFAGGRHGHGGGGWVAPFVGDE